MEMMTTSPMDVTMTTTSTPTTMKNSVMDAKTMTTSLMEMMMNHTETKSTWMMKKIPVTF